MSQPPSHRMLSPYSSSSISSGSSPMHSYEGPSTTSEQASSGGSRGILVHTQPYLFGVKLPPSYQRHGNDVDHRYASHPQTTPLVHPLGSSMGPTSGVSMGAMPARLTGEHPAASIPTSDIVKQLDFATNENIRLRKRLEENNTILDKKIEEFQQLCHQKEEEKMRLQQEASESTNKFFEARVAILGFKCRNLQLQGELDSHRSGQPAPSTSQSLPQQQQQSESGKLREQLDRFQSDNTQLREQLRQERERFRSESGQLREQLQRAGRGGGGGSQAAVRSLHQDVGSLKLENTNLQGVIRELQNDIASLENKERIHNEEIKRFGQEKEMLEERCHKLNEESSRFRSQFAYQQPASLELERLRNELSRYQQMASDYHQLQTQIGNLRGQLQEKQQDLSHLTERNATLQHKIGELDVKLREKLSGSGPVPKPRTNVQNLGAQVERLQREKDNMEEQLRRERQARNASEGQLHTTSVKTQELSLENAQLRSQMEQMLVSTEPYHTQKRENESHLAQLSIHSQGAPAGGEDEIQRLQEDIESREMEIRLLKQQKNEAESRCRELQGQFDTSVREKEREDRRSREFERARREMEGQIAAVHEEKEAEKSAKMKLETKVASLEEQNRLLREPQKGPMSKNVAFKLNEAMGQLKAAELGRQQLLQDRDLLMKDKSRLDEEIRNLREENEIKTRQVDEVEAWKAQSEHHSRQMSQLQQEKESEIMASREREEESISQKLVLQSRVDEYRSELTRQQDQYTRQLFTKEEELDQLREQITSLEKAYSILEHSQTNVQSKQQNIDQLQGELQKQGEEFHSLWSQHSELQTSHDQVTTKQRELQVELSQAQRALSEYQGECEALMQDYQSCAGRLRSAEEDRDKYKKQMDIGMRELTKRADRIKQLEQQRDGAQERVQHMEYQLKQYMDDFNRERVAREEAVEVKKMLEREKAEYQRRMADLRTQLNVKAEVSLREDQFPGSIVDQQSTQPPGRRSPFQPGMMGGGGGGVMVGGMMGSGGGGGGSVGVQSEPSLQHSGEQSYHRNLAPMSDPPFRRSHEQQFRPPHTQVDAYPLPPPQVRHVLPDIEIPRAKVEPPILSDVRHTNLGPSSPPPPPLPPRERRDRPATDWRSNEFADSAQFMAGAGQLQGIHQPQNEFVGGHHFPATLQRPSTTMGGPVMTGGGVMSGGTMGRPVIGGPVGTMGGPVGATMGGPVGSMGGPVGATMGGPVMTGGGAMSGGTMGRPVIGGPVGATMGGPVGSMGGPVGSMGGPVGTMGGPVGSMGGPVGRTMGGPAGATMGGPAGRIGAQVERSMASAMPVLNDLNFGTRPPTSTAEGSIRAQAGNKWAAPGEIFDENPPAMDCPICGRNDFKTQTDLELHSAQCISEN